MVLNEMLLRKSFDLVRPHATQVLEHFYATFSARYPEVKVALAAGAGDIRDRAVMASLSHLVDYAEDDEHFADYLRKLGARHAEGAFRPEHLEGAAEALLDTFAYYFDKSWTKELSTAWSNFLGLIVDQVRIGMRLERERMQELRSAATAGPKMQEMAMNHSREMLKRALDEMGADPLVQELFREKARELLARALEAEIRTQNDDVRKAYWAS